jgi:hypothetical protein
MKHGLQNGLHHGTGKQSKAFCLVELPDPDTELLEDGQKPVVAPVRLQDASREVLNKPLDFSHLERVSARHRGRSFSPP